MGGQFLDVVESARPWAGLSTAERVERARRVIRFKSAKYTIEHPLLIGASAGGASADDLAALSRYGLDLGHAFQLRDDLLGVFGDPGSTGKPAGDDLREGKRTVLIAHTLEGADAAGRQLLEELLGDPDLDEAGVARLREVITGLRGRRRRRGRDRGARGHGTAGPEVHLRPRRRAGGHARRAHRLLHRPDRLTCPGRPRAASSQRCPATVACHRRRGGVAGGAGPWPPEARRRARVEPPAGQAVA